MTSQQRIPPPYRHSKLTGFTISEKGISEKSVDSILSFSNLVSDWISVASSMIDYSCSIRKRRNTVEPNRPPKHRNITKTEKQT